MFAYVISRMNGTHSKGVRVPKLYNYMSNFEVKTDPSTDWSVCIVDDATEIPPAVESDPDILVLDTFAELDTPLSTPKRNAVNAQLALTSWNVTAVGGDTARVVLNKIRVAIGDSAESWGLGL